MGAFVHEKEDPVCAKIHREDDGHKDVVESTHSFETVAHVVVQRREKIVVSQIWAVDVFFVERGLRRL